MAAENRDWYRDWWRKKTGYVERAAFRVSAKEEALRNARARRKPATFPWLTCILLIVLLVVAIRQLMIYLH
jgi:t-SNARE complex subunit (syntaxin)